VNLLYKNLEKKNLEKQWHVICGLSYNCCRMVDVWSWRLDKCVF